MKDFSHFLDKLHFFKSMFSSNFYIKALDKFSIVAITDKAGTIIYANDKFCEISKYSREELLGQNHRILKSGCHDRDFFRKMWRQISQGHTWRGEICNRAKDGSLYWVDSFIIPELDTEGKPFRYYSFRIDITEKKKKEIALEQQNKVLEEIAFIQSHEIRRPLANILGLVQLLDKEQLSAENAEIINYLDKSAQELDEIIHKILNKTYTIQFDELCIGERK
jgi:two-component system CheB/CheR fusion protein